MHTAGRVLLIACLSGAAASAPAADRNKSWVGVEHGMSAEEFRAAGLDKLSPEELAALNQWMRRFLAHEAAHVVRTDEKIRAIQKEPVRRRIQGLFRGWDGDTVFRLDNGEVWKQRLPGQYFVSLQNPEVEIARNLVGFHELTVVATGRKIGVSRVE